MVATSKVYVPKNESKVSRHTIEGLQRAYIPFWCIVACPLCTARCCERRRAVDRQNSGLSLFVFKVDDLIYHEPITNSMDVLESFSFILEIFVLVGIRRIVVDAIVEVQ